MAALPVDTHTFEWYTRVTYYTFFLPWPLVGFLLAANLPPSVLEATVLALFGTAQCLLSVWVGHRAVNLLRRRSLEGSSGGGWPWRSAPERAWLAVTAATAVVIAIWGLRHGVWPGLVLSALVVCSVSATLPALSRRLTLYTWGATAIAVLACMVGNGQSRADIVTAISYAVSAALYLGFVWLTLWILRVMGELEYSRDTAGRLAVAEDRLRISRDLHDVFGRTLATISVKSTLAAELSRRGQTERAASEMEQIRTIADGAGYETRQVVQGRRGVNLAAELQGARSVLESAGVACVVDADARWIQLPVAERLAWVIREAVTNILRHSKASSVRIELSSQDPVTLRIVNDHPLEGTTGTANGLLGMSTRVAEVGGRLSSRAGEDSFELLAEIPNRRVPNAGPRTVDERPPATIPEGVSAG